MNILFTLFVGTTEDEEISEEGRQGAPNLRGDENFDELVELYRAQEDPFIDVLTSIRAQKNNESAKFCYTSFTFYSEPVEI